MESDIKLLPPNGLLLICKTEERLEKPGGGVREELELVDLWLVSDRLFRETVRREGAELFGVEHIFKDAKVPSERLLWQDINDGDVPCRVPTDGTP